MERRADDSDRPHSQDMDEQKAKEAAALGLGPGAVVRRVAGGGSASDVSVVDNFNFHGGDPSDRVSMAPSTRTSASAPAALMAGSGAAPLPVAVSRGSSGRASQNDVSAYDIRAAPQEEDGARSVFSEPPLPLNGSPEEGELVGEAAMAGEDEGDVPSVQDEDELDKHVAPVGNSDAPPIPIADPDADEEQQVDHEDGDQEEPGATPEGSGDLVLEAEVELVAAASPRSPPRRAATWSPPRSPTARTQTSPSMLCGVPVAQIVPAHDEEDGREGDDQSVVRAECEDAPNDAPIEAASQHTHHLRFLGEDIVVATVEDVEAGNAAREPPRRRSSNLSLPSATLAQTLAKVEQGGKRRWCRYGGAILAAIAIAVAVGIVVDRFAGAPGDPESVNGEEDADVQGKDSPPVGPGPPVQLAERTAVMQMLDDFLSESDGDAHRVVGSPQHRAIKWIERTSLAPGSDLDLSPYVDLAGEAVSPLPTEIEERLVQRYALATLYYATGGVSPDAGKSEGRPRSGWKDPSYFLTEGHECQWSNSRRSAVAGARPSSSHSLGVTCDEDLRVTELNLSDNGLSGTLPNELGGLRRLRKIDMSSNPDLGGALPANLGQLSELRLLLLARNALTGTFPSSYGALANLEELNLRGNNLSGTIPAAASDMTSLTNIWLSGNGFTDGMDAFCVPEIDARLFYADCFCRNFPRLEPEVECRCCTMCCTDDGSEEACNPNVSCQE